MRSRLLVWVLLLLDVPTDIGFLTIVNAASCPYAPLTLTDDCNDACASEYQPCEIRNATDSSTSEESSSAVCVYVCYTLPAPEMTLLIEFGSYQSDKEIQARSQNANYDAEVAALGDDTDSYPWVSNDNVTNIESLAFDPSTTKAVIIGGTSSNSYVKSKVVDVKIASDLFDGLASLKKVGLMSMDLQNQVVDLSDLLPSTLTIVNLINDVLTSYPTDMLSSLTSLEELDLQGNYITSVGTSDGLDTVTWLKLSGNNLTEFEAYFPNLTELYLDNNEFTDIPSAIFKHAELKNLDLSRNPLSITNLTSSQIKFLNAIEDLDLSSTVDAPTLTCNSSNQVTIEGITVCVTEDESSSSDNDQSSTSSSSGSNTGVIIGILAAVVVLILGIVIATLRHRRLMRKDTAATGSRPTADNTTYKSTEIGASRNGDHSTASTKLEQHTGSLWDDPELLQVKLSADDIQDVMKLGNGAYGVVWLVKYGSSQMLASKRIQKDHVTRQRTLNFVEEIKLVSKLDHPNIVQFVGCAWTKETDLQALFEYMKNGDLREYLADSNTPREWNQEKLNIAINVAEALVYVHSFQPPLVHRDLKSRNILLTDDMKAKLTDFGVSRYQSQDNTMTIGVGTSRWLAPEVIMGDKDYGPAADIFSFGVVLSELDTHQIPYAGTRGANGSSLPDIAILQLVAAGTLRPAFKQSCPVSILELANSCLTCYPDKRPSAPEVAYALRCLQSELF